MSKDPLANFSLSLEGTNTDMPRLAKGVYGLQIKVAEIIAQKDEPKDDPKKFMIKVEFQTLAPAKLVSGAKVEAGFKLTNHHILWQPESDKAPDFRKEVCFLYAACFKVDLEEAKKLNIDQKTVKQMIGCEISANIGLDDKDEKYGLQNTIGSYKSLD